MSPSEAGRHLTVTKAAREALGKAIARHTPPVVVRLRIVPGPPPTAQLYLAKPWPGEEAMEYGPVRLVVEPGSGSYLEKAVIDFRPSLPGAPRGGFMIEGPGLRAHAPTPGAGASVPTASAGPSTPGAGAMDEREPRLREALRQVYDPEIPVNIVDLGLIYGIEWPEDGRVRIRMTMTSPGCPVATMLHDEVKAVAERIPGIREAEVAVVWDPPWRPERMSPEAKRQFGYA